MLISNKSNIFKMFREKNKSNKLIDPIYSKSSTQQTWKKIIIRLLKTNDKRKVLKVARDGGGGETHNVQIKMTANCSSHTTLVKR